MFYLFTQTFFWLLAAFVLGLLIGWWLRSKLVADTRNTHSQAPVGEPASQADIIPDSWAPDQLYDSNTEDPDSLQKIDGVSSKVEVLLNTVGIYKFEQIGAMTKNNLAWVNDKLGFDDDRIDEEQWVAQARVLASNNEASSDSDSLL